MAKIYILSIKGLPGLHAFEHLYSAQAMAEWYIKDGYTAEIFEGDVQHAPLEVHSPAKPPEYEGG